MKTSTLLVLMVFGGLAWYVFVMKRQQEQPPLPIPLTTNPVGGYQVSVQQDPFQASLHAIQGIFGAVQAWAQTAPKNN